MNKITSVNGFLFEGPVTRLTECREYIRVGLTADVRPPEMVEMRILQEEKVCHAAGTWQSSHRPSSGI